MLFIYLLVVSLRELRIYLFLKDSGATDSSKYFSSQTVDMTGLLLTLIPYPSKHS